MDGLAALAGRVIDHAMRAGNDFSVQLELKLCLNIRILGNMEGVFHAIDARASKLKHTIVYEVIIAREIVSVASAAVATTVAAASAVIIRQEAVAVENGAACKGHGISGAYAQLAIVYQMRETMFAFAMMVVMMHIASALHAIVAIGAPAADGSTQPAEVLTGVNRGKLYCRRITAP